MTELDTNVHDVEATGDIFGAVAEMSDDLAVEQCIEFMEALRKARSQLDDALAMLETQLRQRLDSPVRIGTKIWALKDAGKWRPDHEVVRKEILRQAVADENGEIRTAKEAATLAYELTKRCYIEPSGLPKISGLERLGLDRAKSSHWEKKGTKIEVIDLKGPGDDD